MSKMDLLAITNHRDAENIKTEEREHFRWKLAIYSKIKASVVRSQK
jgi:hypothetical protein